MHLSNLVMPRLDLMQCLPVLGQSAVVTLKCVGCELSAEDSDADQYHEDYYI